MSIREEDTRQNLHERLLQEAALARRRGQSLSVVMADLDHFKKINDTYGQQTGDIVLQHAVALTRSTLRQSDWIARCGGEEFVIVLPETPLQGAYAVAERVRRLCAETPVELSDTQLAVTASFGVATIDGVAPDGVAPDGVAPSSSDAEAMLLEADKALNESKRAGRNRVTCGPKSGKQIPGRLV